VLLTGKTSQRKIPKRFEREKRPEGTDLSLTSIPTAHRRESLLCRRGGKEGKGGGERPISKERGEKSRRKITSVSHQRKAIILPPREETDLRGKKKTTSKPKKKKKQTTPRFPPSSWGKGYRLQNVGRVLIGSLRRGRAGSSTVPRNGGECNWGRGSLSLFRGLGGRGVGVWGGSLPIWRRVGKAEV